MTILSYTPHTNVLKLDIMQADRFKGQVAFPCTPGREYNYEELKAFVRLLRPSLSNKEFEVLPTNQRVI